MPKEPRNAHSRWASGMKADYAEVALVGVDCAARLSGGNDDDRPARPPRRRINTPLPDPEGTHAAVTAARAHLSRLRLATLPMFVSDFLAIVTTCLIAAVATRAVTHVAWMDLLAVTLALFVPIALGNLLTALYPGVASNPVVEFRQLSRVSTITFVGAAAVGVFGKMGFSFFAFLAVAWPVQFGAAPLWRAAVRRFCRSYRWWGYPVLIFGAGEAATTVVSNLLRFPEYGLRPVLVMDPAGKADHLLGLPVVNSPRLAAAAAKRLGIRHAIVSVPDLSRQQATRVVERYARGIRHVVLTSAISPFAPGLPILWRDTRDLAGVAGVEVRNRLLVATPRMIKRSMDVVLTVVGGIGMLPLLGVLALCVCLSSPGPVLYSHTRIGARGRRFKALKFRSMVTNGDEVLQKHLAGNPEAAAEWERDQKLKDDPRVTKIGALMRKTSLDELPQLWNVMRGEMSLVGPRPIVKAEVEKYGKCYAIYKSVRPGITGLWQVSGRNDTTYDERLRFDEFYVRNWSPWLDMHLLARTVSALLGKGAY